MAGKRNKKTKMSNDRSQPSGSSRPDNDPLAALNSWMSAQIGGFQMDDEDIANNLEKYAKLNGPTYITIGTDDYEIPDSVKAFSALTLDFHRRGSPDATVMDVIKNIHARHPMQKYCEKLEKMESMPSLPESSDSESESDSLRRKRSDSISSNNTVCESHIDIDDEESENKNVQNEGKCENAVAQPKTNIVPAKPKPLMVGLPSNEIRQLSVAIEEAGNSNFELKAAGRFIRVFPNSSSDKIEICKILDEKKMQYYIVPDRRNPLKVVLGGLDGSDAETIKTELAKLDFDIIEVKQMTSKKDGRTLPLFLVQLVKSKKSKEILNLKTLFRVRVNIQPFRAQKKATQCYKCQQWYHVAVNCRMEAKCAGGCEDSHETRNCPLKNLTKEEKPPPKCCNCNEAHPSNWKGCAKFPNRKTYAQVAKNEKKIAAPAKKTQKGTFPKTEKKKNQTSTVIEQGKPIYELKEFSNDANRLIELITKIKLELSITSFAELANGLEEILQNISQQSTTAGKKLCFLDQLESLAGGSSAHIE